MHIPHRVLDIFRYAPRTDPEHRTLIDPVEISIPPPGIRIFHVNGDEVEAVLKAFESRGGCFQDGYNIIVPAWELPQYPEIWAASLRIFNEVWALSSFIRDAFARAGVPSFHVGQSVETRAGHLLPRRYFRIRESAFAILLFFDLSSYAARKNPGAVLEVFETLRARRPFDDLQLVLKVKRGEEDAGDWLAPLRERVPEALLLSTPMSSLETRSLINCCDCFVSLHRAEGFGRGTGEAMSLGRLAMATGWSGNLDYMTKSNSLLVDFDLVSLQEGEYPYGNGQHWAEAKISHAVDLLEGVLDDPARRQRLAEQGRRDIRLAHGSRAVGLRILKRISEISSSSGANAETPRVEVAPPAAAKARSAAKA
ncbi:MAG: hypothetical protein J0H57_28690, partial [Rhodospirillales bacterium]|nr:hypothetical protein [Rhodospirillales bacterium]